MSDERARRIAVHARALGYSAVELGRFSDADWRELRERAKVPSANAHDCAEAVEMVLLWEANEESSGLA